MVSASGSGRGRREAAVPQVVMDVLDSWSSYSTLRVDYEDMANGPNGRTALYDRASDPACPVAERLDIRNNQVPQLEAEMDRNSQRSQELLSGIREKIDDAMSAARRLGGSARADALGRLDAVKQGLQQVAEEESAARQAAEGVARVAAGTTATQAVPQRAPQAAEAVPAREEHPGMVQVGGEWMTREEYDRLQQQLGALTPQSMITGGPALGIAPAAAPQFTPEYSTSYSTVMRWYRKFIELENDNATHMRRLERDIRDGNTRSANIQRKGIDENVAEMVQLMANVSRSLSDALFESKGNRRHSDALMEILNTWNDRQQKLLDAMSARGEPPEAARAAYGAASYLCRNSMDDVLSMFLGATYPVAYGPGRYVAPQAPTQATRLPQPTPIPPQTAVVPTHVERSAEAALAQVVVPVGATYFEYVNQRTGKRYRISIDGEDLSQMGIDHVYALAQEYTGTAAKFRKLHIKRVDERGRLIHEYERSHIRDTGAEGFFAEQMGYMPLVTPEGIAASRRTMAEMDRRMQAFLAGGAAPAATAAAPVPGAVVAAPAAAPRTVDQFLVGNGRIYGVDRAGATQLAGFMNGTRNNLDFTIRGEEQANRVYAMVAP